MSSKEPTLTFLPDGNLHIHIPMFVHRARGRKHIIMPNSSDEENLFLKHSAIIQGLARAHAWLKMLETGQVASITELSSKLDVDMAYVVRILRLGNLAPFIVETLLRGDEPDGMSLNDLKKVFPGDWEEQKDLFLTPKFRRTRNERKS